MEGNFTPVFLLPHHWPHPICRYALKSNLVILMFSRVFPKYHSPPHTVQWDAQKKPIGKFNILVLDLESRLGSVIDIYQHLSKSVFPVFLHEFGETHQALHDECPEVDACWSEVLLCPNRFHVRLLHTVECQASVNFILKSTGRSAFGLLSVGKSKLHSTKSFLGWISSSS